MTPYNVNRILLYALLTLDNASNWSQPYTATLLVVTDWLLKNDNSVASTSQALPSDYPWELLVNLQIIALTKELMFCQNQIRENLLNHQAIWNTHIGIALLASPLSFEQKNHILQALKSRLAMLIEVDEFRCLFQLPQDLLTLEQRVFILEALESKPMVVLSHLCWGRQHEKEQRKFVFNLISPHLGRMITTPDQIKIFFDLPEYIFTKAERMMIFKSVGPHLRSAIPEARRQELCESAAFDHPLRSAIKPQLYKQRTSKKVHFYENCQEGVLEVTLQPK